MFSPFPICYNIAVRHSILTELGDTLEHLSFSRLFIQHLTDSSRNLSDSCYSICRFTFRPRLLKRAPVCSFPTALVTCLVILLLDTQMK
ncbi:hypothetical protein K435DRAFT_239441 [Dendrothele bispora CBS 962.96]|uniref:Uncharacterized protein n=1 Tax=Dendrothele bispora (strain CBS 962.96) TaxID=1314807 RepID=A0A4S8MMF3_DENBC|nr:hypothetical protein K435DRAFT_239441 [Dendrothele bispora CBS 962.96]